MNRDSCFQLGYIFKPHGLKGEIKAVFDSDNPSRYKELESVFVEIDKTLIPFFIESIRDGGQHFIIKFEEMDSIESVDSLIGKALWLPVDLLPEIGDDEFFHHEIIGYQVEDLKKGLLGSIQNYYSMGAQDLFSVDCNGKEILIPVAKNFIVKIDKEKKLLIFDLPDGLIDLYLSED